MKETESQCGKASGVREGAERGSDEATQGELPHNPWEREQGAGSWRIPSSLARDNRAKASEEQGQHECVRECVHAWKCSGSKGCKRHVMGSSRAWKGASSVGTPAPPQLWGPRQAI